MTSPAFGSTTYALKYESRREAHWHASPRKLELARPVQKTRRFARQDAWPAHTTHLNQTATTINSCHTMFAATGSALCWAQRCRPTHWRRCVVRPWAVLLSKRYVASQELRNDRHILLSLCRVILARVSIPGVALHRLTTFRAVLYLLIPCGSRRRRALRGRRWLWPIR